MSINVEQTDERVRITSPFWEMAHDLKRGGVVDTIRFPRDNLNHNFKRFSRYKLEEYKFHHGFSNVVTTTDTDVKGAVYAKPDHAIVILSKVYR